MEQYMINEQVSNRQKLGILKVFSNKPISLSTLTRIASQKIKLQYNTKVYIEILDTHFFKDYNVYAVLFKIPCVSDATGEGSIEIERLNAK